MITELNLKIVDGLVILSHMVTIEVILSNRVHMVKVRVELGNTLNLLVHDNPVGSLSNQLLSSLFVSLVVDLESQRTDLSGNERK